MSAREQALVVEDDPLVRRVLVILLERLGFEVRSACDGLGAQDELDGHRFELVVTDLRMPGLDGLGVAKIALAKAEAPRVVVVSGYATREDAERVEALGARLLRKPFELEEAMALFGSPASG